MKSRFLFAGLALIVMTVTPSFAKTNVHRSDFDGSVAVRTDPSWVECPQSKMMCPLVGYAWSDSEFGESYATLIIEINDSWLKSYQSIKQLKLNIDGEIIELNKLTPNQPTNYSHNQISTISTDYFVISLDKLNAFLGANSVKMQVATDKGLYDMIYKGGKKQTRANKMLTEFLSAVEQNTQK